MNIVRIDKHEATTLWKLGVRVYFYSKSEPGVWREPVAYDTNHRYTPPCDYITFSWGVEAE